MSLRTAGLALLFVACLPAAAPAAVAPPSQVTREEVIDEVARFTGLSKDSLSLAVSENPRLLEGLDECVLAVKIVNQFAEAKDVEGLTEVGEWLLGKLKDRLIPAGLGAFLTAVTVYKGALEALRDYTFVPAFESSLYRKYSKARRDLVTIRIYPSTQKLAGGGTKTPSASSSRATSAGPSPGRGSFGLSMRPVSMRACSPTTGAGAMTWSGPSPSPRATTTPRSS